MRGSMRSMHRIPLINGLRGFAMLGVVYAHVFSSTLTPPGTASFTVQGMHVFPLGAIAHSYLAVSLFFIISGFVLALPYAKGKRHMAAAHDVAWFYYHRAWRIFPLYLCVLIPLIVVRGDWYRPLPTLVDAVGTLTGLGGIYPPFLFTPFYAITWTLQIEIVFGLVFPLLIFLMRRYGYTLLLSLSLMVSLSICLYAFMQPDETMRRFYFYSFPGCIDDLVMGMAMAFAFVHERVKRPAWTLLASLPFLYMAFTFKELLFTGNGQLSMLALSETLFPIGVGLFVLALLSVDWVWVRILFCNRALQMAGIMSYSLYLNHYWLFEVMQPGMNIGRLTLYGLAVIGLSILTYRFIEFPTKSWRQLVPEKAMH